MRVAIHMRGAQKKRGGGGSWLSECHQNQFWEGFRIFGDFKNHTEMFQFVNPRLNFV